MRTITLYKREKYLSRLIDASKSEQIKILTGIRRAGKSSLLKLFKEYLLNSGIDNKHIIEINFEDMKFKHMQYLEVYYSIRKQINDEKEYYILLDEIQNIHQWEDIVNSLRVEFNTNIYIATSNSYFYNSKYLTYLSGRFVEIRILPLSFAEFVIFNDCEIKQEKTMLNNPIINIYDSSQKIVDKKELFSKYLSIGSIPLYSIDKDIIYDYRIAALESSINTIIVKDILGHSKNKNYKKVNNSDLVINILTYLARNIGSSISISKIGQELLKEKIITIDELPSPTSSIDYVNVLVSTYLLYPIYRYDLKRKEILKTLGKYYIVDFGIRNYLLGANLEDLEDLEFQIENIVFFELLKRGYIPRIGKINDVEIDFVIWNTKSVSYIQVTHNLYDENTLNRELNSLLKIKDNYKKIILTYEPHPEKNIKGVEIISLLDFLLDEDFPLF